MAVSHLLLAATLGALAAAENTRSTTPPMGWNSYNYYNCAPSEAIIKSNADGLISSGLASLGYKTVTTDCGWPAPDRDTAGKLQFNPTLFPSGGPALGRYLHDRGLKFGLYSGGGYYQCGGDVRVPASLGKEAIDAQTFTDWEGDSLKYDNCFANSTTIMVDYNGPDWVSPTRFQTMANALAAVSRPFEYYVCQWGVGTNVAEWASAIGNTYRISNDIWKGWDSIWRIANQVVPYYKWTKPGAFPDMDMLTVGLGGLTPTEERFHFGLWAINKSPLTIGASVAGTNLPADSKAVLSNKEVISINQDALGKGAQLVLRDGPNQWDVWAGDLSGGRKVVAIANWKNSSQTVRLDLKSVGVASAKARDVWGARDLGTISRTRAFSLAAHELKLLVLSRITASAAYRPAGYHPAATAALTGTASVSNCASGQCLPTGKKVGSIGAGASVKFNEVAVRTGGKKVVSVDFINYDIVFWVGDNTRTFAISVNGGAPKSWPFPISGGDWFETGRLTIELDNFVAGDGNNITFTNVGTGWAPDLVGVEVLE